jgi:hypothetical protein
MDKFIIWALLAVVFFVILFIFEYLNALWMGALDWKEACGDAAHRIFYYFYLEPRDALRNWRCKRARRYLLKYDDNFRRREASLELCRRRDAYYESGGSAESPECPEITDVLEDWGFKQ